VLALVAHVLALLAGAVTVAGGGARLPGGEPRPSSRSFARDVAPAFARWCTRCHGPGEQHGGLRLDSYEAVMRGGDSGPPVIAGDAAASLLVAKIERRDRPPMPPRQRLPAPVVARVRTWIDAGAPP
jgi:Planctomycete cytochrome C